MVKRVIGIRGLVLLLGSLALAGGIAACNDSDGPAADCYFNSAQSNDAASSTHLCLQTTSVSANSVNAAQ
jgi:hypothetical protein